MTEQMLFTDTTIAAIRADGTQKNYRDTTLKKLYCRVTPAGTKTYFYVKRIGARVVCSKLVNHKGNSRRDE